MKSSNFNEAQKWLKRILKNKIKLEQKTIITYLMLGVAGIFSFRTESLAAIAINKTEILSGREVGMNDGADKAKATANASIAIGNSASVEGNDGIALGSSTSAKLADSVAIGKGAKTSETDGKSGKESGAIAIGRTSEAIGQGSTAIGINARSSGQSIAIGTNANKTGGKDQTIGTSTVTIGNNANSGANRALAIGSEAIAKGGAALAIGSASKAGGQGSVVIGDSAENILKTVDPEYPNADQVVAIGTSSNVNSLGGMALGAASKTTGVYGTAIGIGAENNTNFGVALGALSSTDKSITVDRDGYIPVPSANAAILKTRANAAGVSIGGEILNKKGSGSGETAVRPSELGSENIIRRQIHNLAAGTDDTDAVNVAQLKASQTKVVGTKQATVSSNSTVDGTTYTVSATKTTLSSGVGSLVEVKGGDEGEDGIIAYTVDLTEKTKENIQKGVAAKEVVDTKGLTFKGDSGTTGIKKLDNEVLITGDSNITTKASPTEVQINLKPEITLNKLTISGGPVISKTGIDAGSQKITNVANGEINTASKEAINGSQLHNVKTTLEASITKLTSTIDSGTFTVSANEGAKDKIKKDENIYFTNEDKNITVSYNSTQNKFTHNLAENIKLTSVTTGNTKIDDTGLSTKDSTGNKIQIDGKGLVITPSGIDSLINPEKIISITTTGINAGSQKITNLADGVAPNDAVNKSQLDKAVSTLNSSVKAARTEVVKGTNISSIESIVGTDGQTIYKINAEGTKVSVASTALTIENKKDTSKNITDYKIDLSKETKENIQKGVAAKEVVDTKGLTFKGDSGTTGIKKLGNEVLITGDSNITTTANTTGVGFSLNKNLDLGTTGSIKIGDATANTLINKDGVVIKDGPSIKTTGIDAGNKKVLNVEKGEVNSTSMEAINGSQLYAVADSIKNTYGGNAVVNPDGTITISNIGGTGKNNINDAIASSKTEVVSGKNSNVTSTIGEKGQTVYKIDVNANVEDISSISNGDTKISLEKDEQGNKVVDTNGAKIINLANGTNPTDAVNVAQLREAQQNIHGRIDDLDNSTRRGIAGAVAQAGVKFQEMGVNQVVVGAAVGYYKGVGAVAVGVQGAPTENTRIHSTVSLTPGPRTEAAVSVGASWKFNIK